MINGVTTLTILGMQYHNIPYNLLGTLVNLPNYQSGDRVIYGA